MSAPLPSKRPKVKGWCPGAWRPMMSGDGLIVRVRPRMGRLDREQVLALSALALEFGSGVIDLTSRANLQIRGVAERNHERLLNGLSEAGLLDDKPVMEMRRNIVATPFPDEGGLTRRLYEDITANLAALPALPAKMGIALDTGAQSLLSGVSADFRFERGARSSLILRADGAETGFATSEKAAVEALAALADWFVLSGGAAAGRMHRHIKTEALPAKFQGEPPRRAAPCPEPGRFPQGFLLGAAFGSVDANALSRIFAATGAIAMRVTPWRMFFLEGVTAVENSGFVEEPGDPLLAIHACPGAPFCAQAEVETRSVAKRLAPHLAGDSTLHLSGCSKGCAFPRDADVTLVGRNGAFDVVRKGSAWDEPAVTSLSTDALLKEVTL